MMVSEAVGAEGFRTGMVAVMAIAEDLLDHNAHVHAIAPRGGWDEVGDPGLGLGRFELLTRPCSEIEACEKDLPAAADR